MKLLKRTGLFLLMLLFSLVLAGAAQAASLPMVQNFNEAGSGWTSHNPYCWQSVYYGNNDTASKIGFFAYPGADGSVLCYGSSAANASTDVNFY